MRFKSIFHKAFNLLIFVWSWNQVWISSCHQPELSNECKWLHHAASMKLTLTTISMYVRVLFIFCIVRFFFHSFYRIVYFHRQFFGVFFSDRLLSVLRGHSFSSQPQRPMTSDFEGFSIPDFVNYIYFPILILEKEPVFSLLNVQC